MSDDYQSQKLRQLMGSTSYMLFMSVLTIYTIFAIDIDKGFFDKNASVYFSSVHVVAMAIFVIEIVVNSIVEKDYLLHFYFWIDIFSTLMMVLELIWIQDLMNSTDNIQVAVSFARVSKASRFSKIGARSTKILKLMRLIKLMKFFKKKEKEELQVVNEQKLEQISEFQSNSKEESGETLKNQNQEQNKEGRRKFYRPNVDPFEQEQIQMRWQLQSEQKRNKDKKEKKQELDKGTKVGQILKYEIQKNIVIMVMGLIMIVPLLGASTWFNKTAEMEPSTQLYINSVDDSLDRAFLTSWYQSFIQVSINSTRPIISFQENSFQFPQQNTIFNIDSLPHLEDLRDSEQTVTNGQKFQAIFSKKAETEITSWINMSRSVLIIVLLLITSAMFAKDLETYALTPLQKMSQTVQKIEKNPFSVLQTQDQENQDEIKEEPKETEEMELQTNILQKFFIKITSLLALSVGETPLDAVNGSSEAIQNKESIFQQTSCIKMMGIFVCIQLANFQELLAKLQDKASLYMNHILQIFHETAIENGGYVFHQDQEYSLICWKINTESTTEKNVEIKQEQKRKAQLAFMFYIKFCEKIAQDAKLKDYEEEYELSFNQDSGRFHLGFHSGVAYCGTIGSEFKLSLKAMGEDVCIVKSLCRAAGKFKVDSLISETFLKLIPFTQLIVRKMEYLQLLQNFKIDSIETFSFCATINFRNHARPQTSTNIKEEESEQNNQINERQKIRKMFKLRKEILKNNSKYKAEQLLMMCKSYLKKHGNVEEFIDLWKESCNFYEDGQWGHAKVSFQNTKECNFASNDVLTDLRLNQIGNKEEPPSNWQRQKQLSLFL